jgi:flavin-dependent dehydrogenase
MTMSNTRHSDVVVIGAGPAGSAAAAVLAEHGLRVLVLEREKFPRYHIGESLLPFTCFPLKRLGLLEKMRQSAFVKKHSVQFVSPSGRVSQPFYFSTRYEPEVAQTWQVLRSEFDLMLLENARAKGAEVLEETSVRELIREGNRVVGVRASRAGGEVFEARAPITLDCSGREAFSPTRLSWRIAEPRLNKVAVWTYYKGALRDPGIDEGATTVAYVPEKGWFWYIPQHRDMVSVGVVAEGKYLTRDGIREPKEIFHREVGQNAWIERHLAPGTQQGPYFLTGEFSFRSRFCACEGLVVAGDAFGFLDPVFSSGVLLALKSGVLVGDTLAAAHKKGDLSPAQFLEYGRVMREGLENMRKLVYAFYDQDFSFADITGKYPELAGDITDCLSGDVNLDFTKLFQAVAEVTEIPAPLPYGLPAGFDNPLTTDAANVRLAAVG